MCGNTYLPDKLVQAKTYISPGISIHLGRMVGHSVRSMEVWLDVRWCVWMCMWMYYGICMWK